MWHVAFSTEMRLYYHRPPAALFLPSREGNYAAPVLALKRNNQIDLQYRINFIDMNMLLRVPPPLVGGGQVEGD